MQFQNKDQQKQLKIREGVYWTGYHAEKQLNGTDVWADLTGQCSSLAIEEEKKNCYVLYQNGTTIDGSRELCSSKQNFICSKKKSLYEYKVSTISTSWWQAEMDCIDYGGDLLTIDKPIELPRLETHLTFAHNYWMGLNSKFPV